MIMSFLKKIADADEGFTNEIKVDYNQPNMRHQKFMNRKVIPFYKYDNVRAIPSICDGLKPGERKVLYSCFKRNLNKKIKVRQLTGYTAEQSAYHYGELSLAMNIIRLAQNFVGTHNINLLQPIGQFGSRTLGTRDVAYSRLLYTNLSKVTRYLFVEHDDHLYKYLNHDGQSIEPEWYLPIIPLVLVNGTDVSGAKMSSNIPCYNPRDIVENIKRKLNGSEFRKINPWFKGYYGDIDVTEKGYCIRGKYKIIEADTLEITELPLKMWTANYKAFLKDMMRPSRGETEIECFSEHHTNGKVHFVVKIKKGVLARMESREAFEKKFGLSTQIGLSNMVLWNSQGEIKRYEHVNDILQEFFDVRYEFYEKRRTYLVSKLEREIDVLINKKRFMTAVLEGELKIYNMSNKDLVMELIRKLYIPMRNMTSVNSTKAQDDTVQVVGALEEITDLVVLAKEFDYLLSMSKCNLTYENVEELKKQLENVESDLANLKVRSVKDMWNEDLDKFLEVLEEVENAEEQEIQERQKLMIKAYQTKYQ